MKTYVLVNYEDYNTDQCYHTILCLNEGLDFQDHSNVKIHKLIANSRSTSTENIHVLDCTYFGTHLDFLAESASTPGEVKNRTVKDLSWDKERSKLKSMITKKQEEISALHQQVASQDEKIESLRSQILDLENNIRQMQELLKLSEDDLRALVENKQKQNSAMDMLNSLQKHLEVFAY